MTGSLIIKRGSYVTHRLDKLDGGLIHLLGGMEQDNTRFYQAVRMAQNLNPLSCMFLEFSI